VHAWACGRVRCGGTGVVAQCPGVYGATFDTCVIPQHAEQIPLAMVAHEHSTNLWNTAPPNTNMRCAGAPPH